MSRTALGPQLSVSTPRRLCRAPSRFRRRRCCCLPTRFGCWRRRMAPLGLCPSISFCSVSGPSASVVTIMGSSGVVASGKLDAWRSGAERLLREAEQTLRQEAPTEDFAAELERDVAELSRYRAAVVFEACLDLEDGLSDRISAPRWSPEDLRHLFRFDSGLYRATGHWRATSKRQRAARPECEDPGCARDGSHLESHHRHYDSLGKEQICVDLETLCATCHASRHAGQWRPEGGRAPMPKSSAS
jgi:hypothetical protein